MKPWEDMTDAEKEQEGREVLASLRGDRRHGREQVVNILTGEVTEIPEGWEWDNYMEMLHS